MARSIFGTPNGASFWYNSTVKKIVLILGLALVGWACAAEEPHVAEIIAALTESVAKLRAADADAVPMAFWDFDGTIIKGDIGDGFEESDGRGYRGMIEASILAGLTSVYSGEPGVRQWRADYRHMAGIGAWLSQAFDVQMYAGTRAADLEALCEGRIRDEGITAWYFVSSMAIWRALEKMGVENYIVSANIEPLMRGVAPSLGIPRERIRASRTEIVGGRVTTKVLYPIPYGPGKVDAVREFVQVRPHGVAVAGFGNSYRTDGDFLRYIRSQPLPGGVKPLAVMINGGAEPKAFQGLFRRVDQQETCGERKSVPSRAQPAQAQGDRTDSPGIRDRCERSDGHRGRVLAAAAADMI